MIGDNLIRLLNGRPKPLQALLAQIRQENLEVFRLTGELPKIYLRGSKPIDNVKPEPRREKISYVV